MALEHRKYGIYLYEKKRIGKRVVSRYVSSGDIAELFHLTSKLKKEERELERGVKRLEREKHKAFEKEISSNNTSGYEIASVTKNFYSNSNYDDVNKYYLHLFTGMGWTLIEEKNTGIKGKEMSFKKDDNFVSIYYTGENTKGSSNYSITFTWDKRTKK